MEGSSRGYGQLPAPRASAAMFLSLRSREVGTGSGRMRRSVTGAATATAPVTTAPFSPLRFTRLMRADESFTRRLQLHGVHEWHDGCVNTISFTEGGDQLISGSDDQQIVLGCWESGTGKLRYDSGHSNNVFQVLDGYVCPDISRILNGRIR